MRLRIAILLFLLTPWVSATHAQPAPNPPPSDEASKQQERIYGSRGEDVPKGYVVDRSLLSYVFTLHSEFARSLANLGANDRWLDIGAGEGRAVLDYVNSKYDVLLKGSSGGKAKAVAMSIEDRRMMQWHQAAASLPAGQIQYVFGRRLREYSREELGTFQLITDVLGGFSYTRTLSVFMEKALVALEPNGSFYTLLQDVRTEAGTNRPYYPDAPFLTEIANADGSELKVCSWLKRITCVEVICEARADRVPPIEVYRIRKVCNDVSVPGLTLVRFEAGTPPQRRFQMSSPAAGTPATR